MQLKSNLEKIKEITRAFLLLEPQPTKFPFIIQHPIFDSTTVYLLNDDKPYNLLEPKDKVTVIDTFMEEIESKDNITSLYLLIRTPYKLTWVKYCEEYFSDKDLAEYLADAWVDSEDPNQDVNCPISYLVKLFKKCKKEYLMTKEDYAVYQSIPDEIEVYRGVAVGRNPNGLSWTPDIVKAQWFANRFNTEKEVGYVEIATIRKKEILAYFNTRGEKEIVVKVPKNRITISF